MLVKTANYPTPENRTSDNRNTENQLQINTNKKIDIYDNIDKTKIPEHHYLTKELFKLNYISDTDSSSFLFDDLFNNYLSNGFTFGNIISSIHYIVPRVVNRKFIDEDELNKKLAIDIKYWLTDNILNIVDKMTMAFSIESRVPFTDIEVFNISRKLNKDCKVRNGMTKAALREAARKDIPNESYKKKKLGFQVPIREWIKESDFYNEIKDTFNMDIADELFHKDYILKLLSEHKNGVKDNYRRIWAIYSFLKWYQVFFINQEQTKKTKKTKNSKIRKKQNKIR